MTRPLIRYAGYETARHARALGIEGNLRARVDALFRSGKGTDVIADLLKVSEAQALRWLNEARSERLHVKSPYREAA